MRAHRREERQRNAANYQCPQLLNRAISKHAHRHGCTIVPIVIFCERRRSPTHEFNVRSGHDHPLSALERNLKHARLRA